MSRHERRAMSRRCRREWRFEVTRIEDRVEEAKVTPRRQVDATRILYGKAGQKSRSARSSPSAPPRSASQAKRRWRRRRRDPRLTPCVGVGDACSTPSASPNICARVSGLARREKRSRRLAHLPALRKALWAARAAGEGNDNSLHAALKEAACEVGAPLEANESARHLVR